MSYLTESELEAQRELLAEVIKSANDKQIRISASREERAKRFAEKLEQAEQDQKQVDIFGRVS